MNETVSQFTKYQITLAKIVIEFFEINRKKNAKEWSFSLKSSKYADLMVKLREHYKL